MWSIRAMHSYVRFVLEYAVLFSSLGVILYEVPCLWAPPIYTAMAMGMPARVA